MDKRHIIELLVHDKAGVLAKVASLFARRRFNIDSLNVGRTNKPDISKIILTIKGEEHVLEQAEKQANKLIDVLRVRELSTDDIINETCIVKLDIKNEKSKNDLIKYGEIYKAKIEDITNKSVVFKLDGDSGKINSFIDLVKKYGLKDVSRTGITAMKRENE